jgi:hypothetical protein
MDRGRRFDPCLRDGWLITGTALLKLSESYAEVKRASGIEDESGNESLGSFNL